MRKTGLDVLRGLAVILVLFRHSNLDSNVLNYFGWLGVDLFFVLSGFLISNLLFVEYKKNESIQIKRFLLKRAFKIFPPFYFFMFITLIIYYVSGVLNISLYQFFSELFYVQSYLPRIWLHTWSLAVEEQFYIIFSLIMLCLTSKHLLKKKYLVITSLITLLVLSFIMRLYVSYPHRNDDVFAFMQTHLRSDGILAGILISYLLNFTKFLAYFQRRKWALAFLCFLLISPGFLFEGGSFFMNTIGLTLVNIGFSILVLLSINAGEYLKPSFLSYLKKVLIPISFIGVNSYSIYLWHLNSKQIIYVLFSFDPNSMAILYISLSIIAGIALSYLIEKPSIHFRDYVLKKHFVSG